jgi:tRNA modification GTPase
MALGSSFNNLQPITSTIVALSTPQGRGALSVVRLSGPQAVEIIERIAPELLEVEPRKATLTTIRYPGKDEILDQVLITFFPAPRSVTGEHVVEVSCHGSPAVVRQIMDMCLAFGARLAAPGEFSLQALSNGKMNLAQAEAVRDLISSQTQAAAKQAALQLSGEVSKALEPAKSSLVEVIVLLESALEFVEDDLPPTKIRQIEESLSSVHDRIEKLAGSYRAGHLLRDGLQIAIAGRPNVGKSSLFNRLVERERAIVTDLPGTTRDTLSEVIDIGGVPVLLTDTAGIRNTEDDIESMGIERAHRAVSESDLVIVLFDATAEIGSEESSFLTENQGTICVPVINKCDLSTGGEFETFPEWHSAIRISAKTGEGLDSLRAAIIDRINGESTGWQGLMVTNARHYDLLRHCCSEIKAATELLLSGRSEELVLAPLHSALRLLGQITGETTTEDILTEIFATFCIGK